MPEDERIAMTDIEQFSAALHKHIRPASFPVAIKMFFLLLNEFSHMFLQELCF